LYQQGDAIDVWGDGEAKRLGTPALEHLISILKKHKMTKALCKNF
jgi:hypothetical protein